MAHPKIEMTGKIFGRWTVIGEGKFYRRRILYWICKCSCSAETVREVVGCHLRNGSSISCGCIQKEKLRARNVEDSPGRRIVRKREGENYIPSTDLWFKRAKACWDRAKIKGIPTDFSSPYELATYVKSIAPEKCPVFGRSFERVVSKSGYTPWSPSIDRINPKKGYVRGNIQILTKKANAMKQDATPEELIMFANWVLQKTAMTSSDGESTWQTEMEG